MHLIKEPEKAEVQFLYEKLIIFLIKKIHAIIKYKKSKKGGKLNRFDA